MGYVVLHPCGSLTSSAQRVCELHGGSECCVPWTTTVRRGRQASPGAPVPGHAPPRHHIMCSKPSLRPVALHIDECQVRMATGGLTKGLWLRVGVWCAGLRYSLYALVACGASALPPNQSLLVGQGSWDCPVLTTVRLYQCLQSNNRLPFSLWPGAASRSVPCYPSTRCLPRDPARRKPSR